MLRLRAKRVALRHFPRNNRALLFRWLDHSPRGAGEGRLTLRTAVPVPAGTVASYPHPQQASWLVPGAVPILDMIELRNPGAYLLVPAWWFLAPLATSATPQPLKLRSET